MTERAYVLIQLHPGKEEDFAKEIISKGVIIDPQVERIDFVHGSFDLIIVLSGTKHEIDNRILEMRKLPFVTRTEALIPFDLLNWEDISAKISEQQNA